MNKPVGHLPVSTWRIAENANRCVCGQTIEKGFPYLEDDYAEECQSFCVPCAVKDNRNLNAPEPPEPPEKKKPIEMDWVCPECFSNVRCDCA